MIFKTLLSDINNVALAMESLKNITQFNTAETSNLAISNEVKKTNAAIEGVKERINAYGIEIEALKTIQNIYEDTGSKIEVMNWLKDNGYSMFMASNYLDIANEYSELEKKANH